MLHITAGQFKGMQLNVPPHIRPTTDKVRQALFNILGEFVEGARVLDGFAGSGAVGIEALSRGAAFVAFVEQDTEAILAIRDNLARVAPEAPRSAWRVVQADCDRGLGQLARLEEPFDLIVLDPPYHSDEGKKALHSVVEYAMVTPAALVVLEHSRRHLPPTAVGPWQQWKQHRYGETVLSFYMAVAAQQPFNT